MKFSLESFIGICLWINCYKYLLIIINCSIVRKKCINLFVFYCIWGINVKENNFFRNLYYI